MRDVIDLGAQDPELRNSPIAWESLDEEDWMGPAVEQQPVCYFNGVAYPDGTVAHCEDVVLECRQGIWLPVATGNPETPELRHRSSVDPQRKRVAFEIVA